MTNIECHNCFDLKDKLLKFRGLIEILGKKEEHLKNENCQYKQSIEDKEQLISSLKDSLLGELNILTDQNKSLQNEIDYLKNEGNLLRTSNKELSSDISIKERYVNTMKQVESENKQLLSENKLLKIELIEMKEKLNSLNFPTDCKSCMTQKDTIKTLKTALKDLNLLSETKNDEIKRMQREINTNQVQRVKLNDENLRLQNELDLKNHTDSQPPEELIQQCTTLKALAISQSNQLRKCMTKYCKICKETANLALNCFNHNMDFIARTSSSKELLNHYKNTKITLLSHLQGSLVDEMLGDDDMKNTMENIKLILQEAKEIMANESIEKEIVAKGKKRISVESKATPTRLTRSSKEPQQKKRRVSLRSDRSPSFDSSNSLNIDENDNTKIKANIDETVQVDNTSNDWGYLDLFETNENKDNAGEIKKQQKSIRNSEFEYFSAEETEKSVKSALNNDKIVDVCDSLTSEISIPSTKQKPKKTDSAKKTPAKGKIAKTKKSPSKVKSAACKNKKSVSIKENLCDSDNEERKSVVGKEIQLILDPKETEISFDMLVTITQQKYADAIDTEEVSKGDENQSKGADVVLDRDIMEVEISNDEERKDSGQSCDVFEIVEETPDLQVEPDVISTNNISAIEDKKRNEIILDKNDENNFAYNSQDITFRDCFGADLSDDTACEVLPSVKQKKTVANRKKLAKTKEISSKSKKVTNNTCRDVEVNNNGEIRVILESLEMETVNKLLVPGKDQDSDGCSLRIGENNNVDEMVKKKKEEELKESIETSQSPTIDSDDVILENNLPVVQEMEQPLPITTQDNNLGAECIIISDNEDDEEWNCEKNNENMQNHISLQKDIDMGCGALDLRVIKPAANTKAESVLLNTLIVPRPMPMKHCSVVGNKISKVIPAKISTEREITENVRAELSVVTSKKVSINVQSDDEIMPEEENSVRNIVNTVVDSSQKKSAQISIAEQSQKTQKESDVNITVKRSLANIADESLSKTAEQERKEEIDKRTAEARQIFCKKALESGVNKTPKTGQTIAAPVIKTGGPNQASNIGKLVSAQIAKTTKKAGPTVMDKLKKTANKSLSRMASELRPINERPLVIIERSTRQQLHGLKVHSAGTEYISGNKRSRPDSPEPQEKPMPKRIAPVEKKSVPINRESVPSKLMDVKVAQMLARRTKNGEGLERFQRITAFVTVYDPLPEISEPENKYRTRLEELFQSCVSVPASDMRARVGLEMEAMSDWDHDRLLETLVDIVVAGAGTVTSGAGTVTSGAGTVTSGAGTVTGGAGTATAGAMAGLARSLIVQVSTFVVVHVVLQSRERYLYFHGLLMTMLSTVTVDTLINLVSINVTVLICLKQTDLVVSFLVDLISLPGVPALVIPRCVPQRIMAAIEEHHAQFTALVRLLVHYEYSVSVSQSHKALIHVLGADAQRYWLMGRTSSDYVPFLDLNQVSEAAQRCQQMTASNANFSFIDRIVRSRYK